MSVHVRPAGLVYGRDAHETIATTKAGRLAQGHVAYTAVIVEEGQLGATRRTLLTYGDFASSAEPAFVELRQRFEAGRPALAGLTLDRPRIMGVINVTPDSFSDGGQFGGAGEAIDHGRALAADGADILDIGGESTRPGSKPLPLDEELSRVLPVIEGLSDTGAVLSIDTRNAEVMSRAVASGARIVNDVSALGHDPASMEAVAGLDTPVVLMHMRGDPATMQDDPRYDDVSIEVHDALFERIAECEAAGIARGRIVADPGIGFGKTFTHNVELLRGLTLFHGLGVPLLVGASRKGFIGWLTGETTAARRAAGSAAAAIAAIAAGAQLVRVHDVKETAQALAVWSAVNGPCAD